MALPVVSDLFNRANTTTGLGTADTGQAYTAVIGAMKINANTAQVVSPVRSAATVGAGTGGGNSTIEVDLVSPDVTNGGHAIYFRLSDADNWWRLAVQSSLSTYVSGSHYEQQFDGTYTYGAWTNIPNNQAQPSDWNYAPGGHYLYYTQGPYATGELVEQMLTNSSHLVYQHSIRFITPNMVSVLVYDYTSTYLHSLVIEKCVATTVSLLASSVLSGAATHLRVVANGNIIRGLVATTDVGAITEAFTVTDSFNVTAANHGVGYSENTSYSSTGALDNFLVLVANSAPYAVTGMSPSGNLTINRGVPQRLGWVFGDPDANDSQSKFDLTYHVVGSGTWTTITQPVTTSFWDAPAGTFTAAAYGWKVRTYDATGLVGPYCTEQFFTAADAPTLPSITAPTSGGTVSDTATVTWSMSNQSDYQVRTVADLAGVADVGTIYTNSGVVGDAVTRSITVAFAVNNRFEHVQVRVKYNNLWSDWSDARVDVSYTPPMIPTTTLLVDSGRASLNVSIINPTPTGGAPVTAYNDVYVSSVFDTEYRVATGVAPNSVWIWKLPGAAREYIVRILAVGTNGTTISSDPVTFPVQKLWPTTWNTGGAIVTKTWSTTWNINTQHVTKTWPTTWNVGISGMLIGASRASVDEIAWMETQLGDVEASKVFYSGDLPASYDGSMIPSGMAPIVSFKSNGNGNLAAYIATMPANGYLCFHHEPEGGEYANGAAFVTAWTAMRDIAHAARPSIPFGMIAGMYQYRTAGNGYDGSYIPTDSAHMPDFYGVDTYYPTPPVTGGVYDDFIAMQDDARIARWLSFVAPTGKPLFCTEYGRGLYGVNEVQTFSIGSPSSGTWALTFNGQTTTSLARTASLTTIKTAIEALSTVTPGDIKFTGAITSGGTMTLTFDRDLGATNLPQITLSGSVFSNGGVRTINTTVQGAASDPDIDALRGPAFTKDVAWLRANGWIGWVYWWENNADGAWQFRDTGSAAAFTALPR